MSEWVYSMHQYVYVHNMKLNWNTGVWSWGWEEEEWLFFRVTKFAGGNEEG